MGAVGQGTPRRERFRGRIVGLGTTSGVRIVVGRWDSSPFGAFADVMLERPDGHRVLYAPTDEVSAFIADTYVFDEVQTVPVRADTLHGTWAVEAGDLALAFTSGRRLPLGWLLRAVPGPVAASPAWAGAVDPVARRAMRGVSTRGQARSGRREWYGATDLHAVTRLAGSLSGRPLGALAPVVPPTRFGFSSTPSTPAVTTLVTTVEVLGA
jgi:hypothetical protein